MATLTEIVRGLNAVRTVDQAKIAVGEALTALGQTYQLVAQQTWRSDRTRANGLLDDARLPLEGFFAKLSKMSGGSDVPDWATNRNLIQRAYVEIAGVGGELNARRTVSFVNEIPQAARDVAQGIGAGLKTVGAAAGDLGGGIVGGLLTGLGPVVVAVLAIVIYFACFRRGSAT